MRPHLRSCPLVVSCLCMVFFASKAAAGEGELAALTALPALPLKASTHHVQGLDTDGVHFWVSCVDGPAKRGSLLMFDASGEVLREADLTRGALYHPGGFDIHEGVLWIPVAAYRREGPSVIERRDARSLALLSSFECTDHIGCVAVDGVRRIGGNWDSRKLYYWDVEGRIEAVRDNPASAAYQDLKLIDGELVASGMIGKGRDRTGVVDWLDPDTLELKRRIRGGLTDRGTCFMQEGMAIHAGRLLLLPEDQPSRIFMFELPR